MLLLLLFGCSQEPSPASFHFELLRQEQTGLDFKNTLTLPPEFNVFNYMYFYNGGGLAAGDFNGDNLIDLYFTSNQESNRLFLNEGEMTFREVTDQAGVKGQAGWATGATVVDINNDGLLDLYVSQVGDYLNLAGTNQLYVNQGEKDGVPVFRDEAATYGLDRVGFGTQGAFFDYDGDGDLDLYQLNHSLHQNGTFGKRDGKADQDHPLAGDRLLRNDGGRFTDVSEEAGILSSVVGYGLGVVTGDLNADGWPDLYIGNDFHENDYLYLNNQDGTFREVLTERMEHTSRFSMGVDIADINNDGNPEVFSLDMLPEDPFILKSSLGEDGFDVFKFKLGFGYNPQFSRNTLQLNNGNGSFSEIGAFAGVHASDWSWGPLFFDMDDDGRRDLFVSNGIPRRMNDIDYINFKTNDDLKYKATFNDLKEDDLSFIEKMPEIKLANKFYVNDGNLRFTDRSRDVMGQAVSYSSSAVYADLDNDGD
ncbi:MAG: VCBS repeat-containing protein, partial [Bacteroidota bacterium]